MNLKIIDQREKTHGKFTNTAYITRKLMFWFETSENWSYLSNTQQEALHMIASKIARILNGNPNFQDHWEDIQGYAKLAMDSIATGETQDDTVQVRNNIKKPSKENTPKAKAGDVPSA